MNKNVGIFKYKEISYNGYQFDPGELIQLDVEKNIDQMLNVKADAIKNVIVVGAWRGNEVASFLKFPNATIYCFEPNKTNFDHLIDRWGSNKRVICYEEACASFDGESNLNEVHLTGNDSLLPIKKDSATGMKVIKVHTIKTVRLDSVKELAGKEIDLLWADTQGYELEVLSGAPDLLTRTKALFLEVYRNNLDYENAAQYDMVASFLDTQGFNTTAEGLDSRGGGNAFFTKKDFQTDAFIESVYQKRVQGVLREAAKKRKLLNFKLVQLLATFTPVKIKTCIRKILFKLSS